MESQKTKTTTLKEYLNFIREIPCINLKNKNVFFDMLNDTNPKIKEYPKEKQKDIFYKAMFILTEVLSNNQLSEGFNKILSNVKYEVFSKLYNTIKNEQTIELYVHQPIIAQPDIFKRIRKMPSLSEISILKQLQVLINSIKKVYRLNNKESVKIFLVNEADFENDIVPEWENDYIENFSRIFNQYIKKLNLDKNIELISCKE
ncbi:MAG: hypothetical protein Q7J06_11380, partial [Bacteroidales bacterium]|nr:hypothetical protein [Bacteroidales bacterium]